MNINERQTQILKVITDECTGELGLVLDGMEQYNDGQHPIVDSSDGRLIAHDMLEHAHNLPQIGGIEDELIALGGVWFVRGEWDDITHGRPSMYEARQHMAADFEHMIEQMGWYDGSYLLSLDGLDVADVDPGMVEVGHEIMEYVSIDSDCMDIDDVQCENFKELAPVIFALGYKLAEERYNGEQGQANQLYWEIAEAVAEAIRLYELIEGAEFELIYQVGDVHYHYVDPWDDYEDDDELEEVA